MKLKQRLPVWLLLAALLVPARAAAAEYSAGAMILYEPHSGTVLEEKNADARLPIASTTKILTALVVLECCGLEESVTATAAHAAVEGSSMYLRPGERYTVEELLYGLMLASGNDAALALAEHTAGSVEEFAALMNRKCADLGLENSHFVNPHGLDDPDHYSTARDLALLTAAAMENAEFCRFFSTERQTVRGVTYVNHNKLLQTCEGCLGGKTGYTRAAGRGLVSCAEREGFRLICVTLSDPRDWEDHCRAYDTAFAEFRFQPLPEGRWQSAAVLSGTAERVRLDCGIAGIVLPRSGETKLDIRLPRFVFAPVRAGTELGRVTVLRDGAPVFSAPIRCAESVALDRDSLLSPWERFCRRWALACRVCTGPLAVKN